MAFASETEALQGLHFYAWSLASFRGRSKECPVGSSSDMNTGSQPSPPGGATGGIGSASVNLHSSPLGGASESLAVSAYLSGSQDSLPVGAPGGRDSSSLSSASSYLTPQSSPPGGAPSSLALSPVVFAYPPSAEPLPPSSHGPRSDHDSDKKRIHVKMSNIRMFAFLCAGLSCAVYIPILGNDRINALLGPAYIVIFILVNATIFVNALACVSSYYMISKFADSTRTEGEDQVINVNPKTVYHMLSQYEGGRQTFPIDRVAAQGLVFLGVVLIAAEVVIHAVLLRGLPLA
ncbi:hypothetical protein GGX14DRAFT_384837 [Mycena pura]|uniref:Uncharacterized protein n=1 Tax=Mycena pura TaxID=153505 RepID=A0AAD6YSJ6_9AGAR|nr:hypothetical protein GGX14DRAFT_384837 [Mycena pura]